MSRIVRFPDLNSANPASTELNLQTVGTLLWAGMETLMTHILTITTNLLQEPAFGGS